jgi:hypothetical protein
VHGAVQNLPPFPPLADCSGLHVSLRDDHMNNGLSGINETSVTLENSNISLPVEETPYTADNYVNIS